MHAVGLEESSSHAERTFVKVTPRVPACLPAHTRMGPPVHTYLYTYPATRTCIRAQPYTPAHLHIPVYVPARTQAIFSFAQANENVPEDQGLEITGQLT